MINIIQFLAGSLILLILCIFLTVIVKTDNTKVTVLIPLFIVVIALVLSAITYLSPNEQISINNYNLVESDGRYIYPLDENQRIVYYCKNNKMREYMLTNETLIQSSPTEPYIQEITTRHIWSIFYLDLHAYNVYI